MLQIFAQESRTASQCLTTGATSEMLARAVVPLVDLCYYFRQSSHQPRFERDNDHLAQGSEVSDSAL
jgi:hypothetical protein